MPKMGGLETLKKLKEIDGFNIPVVALTADAVQGKSTKYIEAGFNDYLAKPIEKDELRRVLYTYLEESKENMHVIKENIEEPINKIDMLKEKDIDVDSSLELLGDIETYNETLKDFLTENETRIPNMKKYKEECDMANYAILAHAMKSDSKYLGFKKLAELSYNHEMKGKENNQEYVDEMFEELMNEVTRITDIIKNYLKD